MNTHLLIIDPQQDFCSPNGSLFVPGADQDMIRLAAFINRMSKKIDDVHVTLDSHRLIDVAHPLYWSNSNGEHPAPFTIISSDDVVNGVWTTTNPAWKQRGVDYVKALETNCRYPLCIWPPHTLIASTKKVGVKDKSGNVVIVDGKPLMVDFCGHAVVEPVSDALLKWQEERFGIVDYLTKGSNIMVEHYSAVQSEVPDPSDPTTMLNTDFIEILQNADNIIIAGEALSHCLANSVRDISNNFGDENIKKLILLTDCSSSVTGFENLGEEFVKDMVGRGMQVSTSVDCLT